MCIKVNDIEYIGFKRAKHALQDGCNDDAYIDETWISMLATLNTSIDKEKLKKLYANLVNVCNENNGIWVDNSFEYIKEYQKNENINVRMFIG